MKYKITFFQQIINEYDLFRCFSLSKIAQDNATIKEKNDSCVLHRGCIVARLTGPRVPRVHPLHKQRLG